MKFVSPAVLAMMLPAQRAAIPRNRYGAAQFVRKLAEECVSAARGAGKVGALTTAEERVKFAQMAAIYYAEARRLMAIAPIRDREAGPSVYVAYKDARAERPSARLFAKMANQPLRMGIVKHPTHYAGPTEAGLAEQREKVAKIVGGIVLFSVAVTAIRFYRGDI